MLNFFFTDAHTVADVDYMWKGGDNQGIEIVSSKMAQFDLLRVETFNDASTNSKGNSVTVDKICCSQSYCLHVSLHGN